MITPNPLWTSLRVGDIRAPLNRALGKGEKQRCRVNAPAAAKKSGRDPSRGAQSLPTAVAPQ
jgi:hypothetical protein